MRFIICGCEKAVMEYLVDTLGLIARRERSHLTVTAPDEHERNDDMCRYVTFGEDVHTDIGKGMADALIVYKYSAGIRRIENLKNSGKLILVQDEEHTRRMRCGGSAGGSSQYDHSLSLKREENYLKNLLYLKNDAVIVEKRSSAQELFRFYAEEEVLKLLGLR